jgi:hypothetical protein
MGRELPQGLQPVFDYGSINDHHQEAAEEIIGLLRQMGIELPIKVISERFKLSEPNRFDFLETKFAKAARQADIFLGVQGFVVNHADPDKVEYPVISISEDVRKLETLYYIIRDEGLETEE